MSGNSTAASVTTHVLQFARGRGRQHTLDGSEFWAAALVATATTMKIDLRITSSTRISNQFRLTRDSDFARARTFRIDRRRHHFTFDQEIFQKNIALRAFASYRTRVSYMRGKFLHV
jgi:hypothetical protein